MIQRQLGKGGTGAAYLATDQTSGSTVALKETIVQCEELEATSCRSTSFFRKRRAAATLYHPLTATKPVDVARRLTSGEDPLRAIHELAPTVPRQVPDVTCRLS